MQSSESHNSKPIVIFRSIRSEMGSIIFLFILIVASVFLTVSFEWSVQKVPLGMWAQRAIYFPLPLFALLPLALLAKILHAHFNYRYILCDDYVLEVRGLWDFRRESIRLNYVHIRGVDISETLWQQLWRVGDLHVLSDISVPRQSFGEPTSRIEMKGIARARRIKDLIQERIQGHVSAKA